MANKVYENFVLENKLESILTTKVDLSNYVTPDYSLTQEAGMKKTINKYKAVGNVEDLKMGEGNTGDIKSTFEPAEYEVTVTQGRGVYYDEEAMKDPMIVDTIIKGMAETMVNDFNTKAIEEMKKADLIIECDFATSTSGYLFDKVVDALALFGEDESNLTILINPNHKAYFRKQLKDDLKYSEGFVRTGYIGSVSGVPVVISKAVPDSCAFIVNKEAVTLFIKKGSEAEQDRDADHRKNTMWLRKVALVALTDSTKLVELAKAQETACEITTYTANAKTIAGTCGEDVVKVVVVDGKGNSYDVTPVSGSWTVNAKANLASTEEVTATAYAYGFAPSKATKTVA